MRNNQAMRASFEKDFEVKWDQATPQLQLGYAKGFHTGRQLQLDIDLSADVGATKVDFDPSKAPTLREIAQMKFDVEIKPNLERAS